jgi:hypothetical protein
VAVAGDSSGAYDPGAYCREVESYLCHKNDGHLIRIVGPAFELVSGWAARGIPLRVTFEGVDRFFERYYRKGARRRPVHISFCEDDVLDVFDAWCRATGVPSLGDAEGDESRQVRPGLTRHLERTIAALVGCRGPGSTRLDAAIDAAVRELDVLKAGGKVLRGEPRAAALARLQELDVLLSAEARASLPDAELAALTRDAEESLTPFRSRMTDAAWREARAAAIDRAVRGALHLPVIAFEA